MYEDSGRRRGGGKEGRRGGGEEGLVAGKLNVVPFVSNGVKFISYLLKLASKLCIYC